MPILVAEARAAELGRVDRALNRCMNLLAEKALDLLPDRRVRVPGRLWPVSVPRRVSEITDTNSAVGRAASQIYALVDDSDWQKRVADSRRWRDLMSGGGSNFQQQAYVPREFEALVAIFEFADGRTAHVGPLTSFAEKEISVDNEMLTEMSLGLERQGFSGPEPRVINVTLVHNHPNGVLELSDDDVRMAHRIFLNANVSIVALVRRNGQLFSAEYSRAKSASRD